MIGRRAGDGSGAVDRARGYRRCGSRPPAHGRAVPRAGRPRAGSRRAGRAGSSRCRPRALAAATRRAPVSARKDPRAAPRRRAGRSPTGTRRGLARPGGGEDQRMVAGGGRLPPVALGARGRLERGPNQSRTAGERPRGPRPTTYRVFPTRGGAPVGCPRMRARRLSALLARPADDRWPVARGRPRAGHTGTGSGRGSRSSSAGRSPCRRGTGGRGRGLLRPGGGARRGDRRRGGPGRTGHRHGPGERVGDRRRRRDPPRRERARRRRCPGRRAGPDRPGAKVAGDTREETQFSLEAPLAVLGELLGPVAISISVLILGLVLVLLAPRGADAVADALGAAPLASLGWGSSCPRHPRHGGGTRVSVLGVPLGLALFLSLGFWWLVGLTWAAWCAGRALVHAPAAACSRSSPAGRSSPPSDWCRS